MTHDQLKILDMIVRTGSFNGAAQKLYRTQPAISIAIKKLEEELEISIFSRDRYRPNLTPEGKIFYNHAQQVLNQMEVLAKLGKRLSAGIEPEVRLAFSMICPMKEILGQIKVWEKRFPQTQFQLTEMPLSQAPQAVVDGSSDFALGTALLNTTQLEIQSWGTVFLIPVAHATHPLARATFDLRESEIKGYVQIMVHHQDSITAQVQGILNDTRRWIVNNYNLQKYMIEQGFGWGFMPEHWVKDDLATRRFAEIKVKGISSLATEIKMMRRADFPLGIVHTAVWEDLQTMRGKRLSLEALEL